MIHATEDITHRGHIYKSQWMQQVTNMLQKADMVQSNCIPYITITTSRLTLCKKKNVQY